MFDTAPLWQSSLWAGGRVRMAAGTGLPFGLLFGVFLAARGDYLGAGVAAVVGGPVFGALTSVSFWNRWASARTFTGEQRREIVRAVSQGRTVEDPGLEPGVLDFADVVLTAAEKDLRAPWLSAAVLLLVLAVSITFAGTTREVVAWCAVAAALLPLAITAPRRSRRLRSQATLARRATEEAATNRARL